MGDVSLTYYNKDELIEEHNLDFKENGFKPYKIWIDISDPSEEQILVLEERFNLDKKALEKVRQNIKKPVVTESYGYFNIIDNNNETNNNQNTDHKFAILLDLKFSGIQNLQKTPVYFFVGKEWLITLHPSEIDLLTKVKIILTERKSILSASIDALYYSILSYVISSYEQLLSAIEIKVFDIEKDAQYRPSMQVLRYLDLLSRQVIMLRRHFWDARNILNYHTYMEKDKDDIRYLQIVQDNINQLIEMIQSYQDTINSARGLFSDSISLQTNETMRVLTIFSAIALPISLLLGVLSIQGFDLNNLESIPKYFGYVLLTMISITIVLLFIFWKKQWIFSRNKKFPS